MSQAVFDLCYFDEAVFDYEIFIIIAAARLNIRIGRKSLLAADSSTNTGLKVSTGKKVRINNTLGTKADILVDSGHKSSLDIELLGGGA